MKRGIAGLFAVAALLLGACAPVAVPPLTAPPSVSDKEGEGGLHFVQDDLWFKAGLLDAFDVNITIRGKDLRVNAPQHCQVKQTDILCTVPVLPAGKNFVLPMTGSNISAVAVYKRVSGQQYSSVAQR